MSEAIGEILAKRANEKSVRFILIEATNAMEE